MYPELLGMGIITENPFLTFGDGIGNLKVLK